jgi:leader peptidase (prepilin peptidase) / N-methyltransferase
LNWDYLILINSSSFVILLGIIDYRTKLLPNKIVFSFLLTNIFLILVSPSFDLNNLIYSISSSLLVFLVYLGIYFISKRTFGLGDVKYSYALSLAPTYLYGFNETINMHLVAFIVGGIFSILLMLVKNVSKNHEIAFGPFMSVSFLLFLVLNL